ncbi:MAG: hypothetical protein ACFFAO_15050 [Candidatus Hermodarchaeota archaeon]
MVIVLHRQIQIIDPEKWDELEEINKKFDELEKQIGFPDTKKRWRAVFGTHHLNTHIVEFVWESMAKLEKTMVKALINPEYQKLQEEIAPIIKKNYWEIYTPLPLPF